MTTQQCQSIYPTGNATAVQSLACSPLTVTQLSQAYKAVPSDCCNKCVVRAGAVRLVYWPPPATANSTGGPYQNATATPVVSRATGLTYQNITAASVTPTYGLVSDGFTFVSPSVYLIYTDVRASASCIARTASSIDIETTHRFVTRAYAPDALSSANCVVSDVWGFIHVCHGGLGNTPKPKDCFTGRDTGWGKVNYAELYNPPSDAEILARKQPCFNDQSIDAGFASQIFVSPQLSLPHDVTDIDPQWVTWGGNTCTATDLGVLDPPSALGQATALRPVAEQQPTPVIEAVVQNTPAQPAGQVQNPEASPTNAPVNNEIGVKQGMPNNDPNNSPTPQNMPQQSPQTSPDLPQNSPQSPAQNSVGQPDKPNDVVKSPTGGAPQNGNNNKQITDPSHVTPEQMDQIYAALSPSSSPVAAAAIPAPAAVAAVPLPNPQTVPVVLTPVNNADAQGAGTAQGSSSNPSKNAPQGSTQVLPINDVQQGDGSMNSAPVHDVKQGGTQNSPIDNTQQPGTLQNPAAIKNGQTDNNLLNPVPVVQPLPVIGSQPIQKQPNGDAIVAGSTLPVGSQTTVAGHVVSNGLNNVVVDGSTHSTEPTQVPAPAGGQVIGNNQIVQISNGNLQLAGQTIAPGTHTTISGQAVDYSGQSQVIVDGTTHALSPVSTSNPLIIGDQTLSRAPNNNLAIAGSTIAPDGQATIAGHTYSVAGTSSVIADGNTYALPPTSNAFLVQSISTNSPTSNAPIPLTLPNGVTVAPAPATPGQSAAYTLPNGSILSAGGPSAIISGTTYSALPSSSGFLINGATVPLPTPTPSATHNTNPTQSLFTAGSSTFTAGPTGIILAPGTTLTPGGSAATISGTAISLNPSGALVLGSSTIALPTPSLYTVGNNVITAAATAITLGPGTTLHPGDAAVTLSGTAVSLGQNSMLQIGTANVKLPAQSVFTLSDGETVTANPTGFIVGGQTLVPGKDVTVGGEDVSLGSGGVLKLGSAIVTLAVPTGGGGGGGSVPFTGGARGRGGLEGMVFAVFAAVGVGALGVLL